MKRWIWLCPVLSVTVVIGALVAFGPSLWTAILAALVLGCPIVALWAFFTGRLTSDRRDATRRFRA